MGMHKFVLALNCISCVCVREYIYVFSNSMGVEQRNDGNLDLSWIVYKTNMAKEVWSMMRINKERSSS